MVAPRSKPAPDDEVLVPFPEPLERLHLPTNVRSTLIASSVAALRTSGHFDDYVARLPEPWRDLPLRAIAGTWLPIEAGVAHYRACDALGLSVASQIANGRETGDRIHGTFLGAMVHAAKTVGVTPWNVFPYTNKLYVRLFDGGGFCVTKAGPKDARAELAQNPLAGIPYYRRALCGLWRAAIELFCTRSYVTEVEHTEFSCKMRIAWA